MRTTGSPIRFSLTALFTLCAATLLAAAVSAGSTSFGVPTVFGPGAFYALQPSLNGAPGFLDVGDLNGDGVTDVVVGDGSKPTRLQLLMGTGGGGLNPAAYLPVTGASDTYRVLASDLDNDGDLDLVAANNQTANLSVLHNAGGGSFLAPTNYPVAGGTRAAGVGDLNGDGVKDLVGANIFSQVVVFLGKPTAPGFFTSGVTYTDAGNNRQSVYIADVTGDGKNDVIAGNRDSSNISIFPGNGDGTLGTAVQIGSGTTPGSARGDSLVIKDFNGDSLLDIVAPGDSLSEIVVYLNQGGSFGAATSYPTGGVHSLYVDSADFNQDGNLDLVVSNVETGRNFSILHGDGTGAFGPPTTLPNPLNLSLLNGGRELRVADFNNDGKPDVAIVATTSRVVIFLNNTITGPASCDPGKYLSGNACVDAPAGSYSPGGTATSATPCAAGYFSAAAGASVCTPAPAGSFVSTTGATGAELCTAGTYSSTLASTACSPAPAGTFVATAGGVNATPCAAGTYSDSPGSILCTPAPAGSYVPTEGATSATACPAHYSSNVGATSCFPLDTDNDGVKDFEDAVINSNVGGTVSVGGCTSGVANQVMPNGATFNDLMSAAVSSAANHGARVSAVSALANGWKGAGLISGRDHGAIVSCVAKSK